MERYFILDKFNTWYDFNLILTKKTIPDAQPKTNYVKLDGMNGSLDLSEALTGEITYEDREIQASFWTDKGTRKDREALLRKITFLFHGKKIKIVEPDDSNHYFYGRVSISNKVNNLAYAEFTINAVCDPWRYAVNEVVRSIDVDGEDLTNVVINNDGVKTLSPIINVVGSVNIAYDGQIIPLTDGDYIVSDIKFRQGVTIVGVSGNGRVTFSYREADL